MMWRSEDNFLSNCSLNSRCGVGFIPNWINCTSPVDPRDIPKLNGMITHVLTLARRLGCLDEAAMRVECSVRGHLALVSWRQVSLHIKNTKEHLQKGVQGRNVQGRFSPPV